MRTFLRKLVLARSILLTVEKLVVLNLAAVFSVSPACVPATEEIQMVLCIQCRERCHLQQVKEAARFGNDGCFLSPAPS